MQRLLDSNEILETLTHLLTLNVQVTCVKKVVDPLMVAMAGLRLRNLIVVMREGKINTTGMDINLLAKHLRSHDGALNVPARAAFTPRRSPCGLTRLTGLPQRKGVVAALASAGGE